MTLITNSSGNGDGCRETQNSRRDCYSCQIVPPSGKKSNCHVDPKSSFQGCIELSVDKCKLAHGTKSPKGSKSKLCVPQSPKLKRSPNGSKSALCDSQSTSKPKQSYGMPSSCCASHAPKVKKTPSSSSAKLCTSRKSSKQSMRGKACTKTGDNWCDCRNMPTKRIDCERKVCIVPDEGKFINNEWWCDCRGVNKKPGKKLCIRPGPIIPKGNLQLTGLPLEGDTTYKTDYTGKYGPPREAMRPKGSINDRCGLMSGLTTQKVDYQPKPHSKRDPIYPPGSSLGSTGPMEGETTTMHDYPAPRCFVPAKSFRPIRECRPNLDPMQDETTHKADYVDWHSRGPQGPFPWTPGNKFMYPSIPMLGDTTYKTDYTVNGMGDRRMPILPKSEGIGLTGNMSGCTTYKHDYIPWECVNESDYNAPQEPIKCYKLEGETPEDKKFWCYKSEDVCPYYPPKAIDGAIPGTTQYVVTPSEGEKPCVAPKPPFNTYSCDPEAMLRITCPPNADKNGSESLSGCKSENSHSYASHTARHENNCKDYNYSTTATCGSSKRDTKQHNYNTDPIRTTANYTSANQPCGPDNYSYSFNQVCRPSYVETKNCSHETNQTCGTNDYNNTANQPCGSSKKDTNNINYNPDVCATTNYMSSSKHPCGPDNYNYSFNQVCRPSHVETKNYNHETNQTCGTNDYNNSAVQPCSSQMKETKQYDHNANVCATTNYKSTSKNPCGHDNYSYSLNQLCHPSKQETKDYNQDIFQVCGASYDQPCGSTKVECKDKTKGSNHSCGFKVQESQTYAPFQECSNNRQEAKAPPVAYNPDPCCGTATQYKPKETSTTSQSKPFYSIGQKFDQNCACMSQPTSRFTTHEERVLTVHC